MRARGSEEAGAGRSDHEGASEGIPVDTGRQELSGAGPRTAPELGRHEGKLNMNAAGITARDRGALAATLPWE